MKDMELVDSMNGVLSGLRVKGTCVNAESHRHLAFFDIKLNPGTRVRTIENNIREIALGIRSQTSPIVKVVPKEGIVRLQVAMRPADKVTLTSLITGQKVPKVPFPMLLGETDEGKILWSDMAQNPHLLIGGTSGSGKSVLLHNIIFNVLAMKKLEFRLCDLYLVDPKLTEFADYADLAPVISEYDHAVALMERMIEEMERRFVGMRFLKVKGIEQCWHYFKQTFVIFDEFADLLAHDKSGVLSNLTIRLAQKGRAAGIYLVLATQRPTKDVFPTTLKANFGRIACRTTSQVESRVILDSDGAENLLGRGDAILRNMEHDRVRFQVAYTDPACTRRYLKL